MSDEDTPRLDRALAQLSEHFDSVQIIATRHTGTHTSRFDRGTGNLYSRLGAVAEWLHLRRSRVHVHVEREDDD